MPLPLSPQPGASPAFDDDGVRAAVLRLSRPHPSGGRVIEHAAVMASGPDSAAIMRWVLDRGEPEALPAQSAGRGLHGLHASSDVKDVRRPLRYVIAPGVLSATD